MNIKSIPVAVIIAALCVACSLPTASDVFIADSDTTTIEQNSTLFIKDTISGNDILTFKTNDKKYINGGKGSTLWTLQTNYSEQKFEEITVETEKTSGNTLGGYGVVFCIQGNRMLSVLINNNRQYAIGKITDGRYERLNDWKPSSNLHQGTTKNRINIKKDGSKFVLSFNDTEEIRFFDPVVPRLEYGNTGYVVIVSPSEDFPKNPVDVRFKKIKM